MIRLAAALLLAAGAASAQGVTIQSPLTGAPWAENPAPWQGSTAPITGLPPVERTGHPSEDNPPQSKRPPFRSAVQLACVLRPALALLGDPAIRLLAGADDTEVVIVTDGAGRWSLVIVDSKNSRTCELTGGTGFNVTLKNLRAATVEAAP